jgi:hypothetical protein
MLRIHQAVSSGRFPNASTLAREIEVASKTIHRDIEFMRDRLNLPIEFDSRRNGYGYTEEVGAFPTLQITEGELFALVVAEKALQQYRGTSFEKPLLSAIKKMEQALPDTISLNLADMVQTISFRTRAEPILDLKVLTFWPGPYRSTSNWNWPIANPASPKVNHASSIRITWRISMASGSCSRMTMAAGTSVRLYPHEFNRCNQRERPLNVRRNFHWRNACATVLVFTPVKANTMSSSALNRGSPTTFVKRNGTSRSNFAI